ncbi:translocator protein [Halyomorpha halys]|uniref:translocator protein n=1 Tax=Halyomorpha halys TaxID=286706 RepID=UPI0006D51FE5|nr:translocator protein [Halyomorpha halys]
MCRFIQLIVAVALPAAGGFLCGYFFPPDDWYQGLKKSDLVPPNWVFPVAWTVLYLAIGLASFLIWNSNYNGSGKSFALILYTAQVLLNWAWTPIFFGAHQVLGALIDLLALFVVSAACTITFFRVNLGAGFLMIPYVLWLGFASYLNLRIYQLN